MDNRLTLGLTVEQINIVLAALAKLPFESVADLIVDIRNQAQKQLEAQEPAPETPPAADAE